MKQLNNILILVFFSVLSFLIPLHSLFADDSKVLLIKGNNNYPPFEFLNAKKLPEGFNVDIMRAVAKGNSELLAKINEGLSIIKISGQYDKIYNKWFGAYESSGLDCHKFLKYLLIIVLPLILIIGLVLLWGWILRKQVALKTRQLLQSIENLKITLNSIGDAVIATNINGEITSMNPVAVKFTGWEIEEAKGKPLNHVFNIVNAKTLEEVENPVERVIKTGKIMGIANHTLLISKHGKKYHIADSAAPIKDTNDVIQGVVLVFRDVTQEYNMQEKLYQSQEIFLTFMDSFPGDAFIKDNNLKFVFINSHMKKSIGASTWLGKDLFEIPIPIELAQRITKDDKKALKAGKYKAAERKIDKDKIYRDYLTYRFAIEFSHDKKFVGGISLDITKLKQTEKALKKSEEKYRRLLETTSEGFLLTNYDNKIIDANQSLCNMLGYSMDEIMGKTPFDLVDCENRKIFEKQISMVKVSRHRTYEIFLRKKNKEIFPALFNATTLMDKNENNISSFAFVTDLTKQKKDEKELQKMEQLNSIGTLAGGIAHDFNNIMTGLFGNISIAKSEIPKEHPAFKTLEKAENSINRARKLTHQLLTFAKGGAPVQEHIPIDKLAREVIMFDLSGSSIKPVFNNPKDLWRAKADKAQMQQVFSNITINAVQAMPHGGHLYVNFENTEITGNSDIPLKSGAYIKIVIKDQGAGIDKKHLDHIFDPYFTTKERGSGLGLATVYSIINRHSGFIEVDTGSDTGTAFTFYLPAIIKPHVHGTIKKDHHNGKKDKTTDIYGKARILVMDDEEMIREVASEMLKRKGYTVETASDGKMAIEMYKDSMAGQAPFDAIIMDLTIPGGMGGEKALKGILAINPEAVVIVSSGYGEDPVMSDYAEYGFKGIIAKPYIMDNLDKILKQVLE